MPRSKKLTDYPRPNVAVDLAVLSVVENALCVRVLRDDDGSAALPGRFIREGSTVAQTVDEVLDLKLGLSGVDVEPHLLAVFSEPGRDPRGWTISIAHSVALPSALVASARGEWVAVNTSDGPGDLHLRYDHDRIVAAAVADMRERYEDLPDPDGLQPQPFTLSELRATHEAVLGRKLMRDTFNRRIEPLLVAETDGDDRPVTRIGGGRPARLFRLPHSTTSFGWRLPGAED